MIKSKMKPELAIPRGKAIIRPLREPDYFSKRGVAYWWSPEWIRGTSSSNETLSRIYPNKVKKYNGEDGVELYMLSKEGKITYIQGSIQQEFADWHLKNEIDYILLGLDIDEVSITNWEYK